MNTLSFRGVTWRSEMQRHIVHELPLETITSRRQVRHDPSADEELTDLAQSIRELGVQQPIRVRREGELHVIVFGERRWHAARLAGLTTIPAVVVDDAMSESSIVQAQLVENIHRSDLTPLEQAEAIDRLIKTSNCTAAAAAKLIGRSPATVSKLLALLTLPADAKAKVASGEIGMRAGHQLARSQTPVAPDPPASRKQKLTAILDRDRAISTTGVDSTMDAFLDALEFLVARVRAAAKQKIELPTLLAMLRDQAGR